MTTDKDFKKQVRARANKTGESYSTARMHLADVTKPPTTRHHGGAHAETTALRHLLAHQGLALTEAMVLGTGGGIGAGYVAITHGTTGFMMGARANWWDSPAFMKDACERLGVTLSVKETTSAKAALKNVQDLTDSKQPAMVWLDQALLPYSVMGRGFAKGGYHCALVYELDDNRALVGDTSRHLLQVSAADLAAARASITSFKNRVASVAAPVKAPDVKAAALDGIRACAQSLVKGRSRTFVLDGFKAWGDAVAATRGKDAWSTLFKTSEDQFRALTSILRFVEQWSGSGLLRPLYADFLDEAAALLKRPALKDVAAQYRQIGQLWHTVAVSALPQSVPLLREAREQMTRARTLLDDKGDAAVPDIQASLRRQEALNAQAAGKFPLKDSEVKDLFSALGGQILAAHALEVAAQQALEKAAR